MGKVNLSSLSKLLDARTRASQAKLRQIMAREAALATLLAELSKSRQRDTTLNPGTDRTTLEFQNEMRHLRWVDQRRAMVNIEIAQVRAMADIARQDLNRHYARQNALDQVSAKQSAKMKRIQERRAAYGS